MSGDELGPPPSPRIVLAREADGVEIRVRASRVFPVLLFGFAAFWWLAALLFGAFAILGESPTLGLVAGLLLLAALLVSAMFVYALLARDLLRISPSGVDLRQGTPLFARWRRLTGPVGVIHVRGRPRRKEHKRVHFLRLLTAGEELAFAAPGRLDDAQVDWLARAIAGELGAAGHGPATPGPSREEKGFL
jgi:hypothetical protein